MTTAILLVGGLCLALLVVANQCVERTRWQQCLRCGQYFNHLGETRKPYLTLNVGHPGVCPECSRDVTFNRE